VLPVGTENQYTRQVDIFAFGLATLELATKHKARAVQTLRKPSSSRAACAAPCVGEAASGLARQTPSAVRPMGRPK